MSSQAAQYAACVDIGGTKVAVSLVCLDSFFLLSESGAASAEQLSALLLAKQTQATIKVGESDALPLQVLDLIRQACAKAEVALTQISQVALSSCGPFVRMADGLRLVAPNICGALGLAGQTGSAPNNWSSIPLESVLRQHFAQVRIENDAVAALQAEQRWGALRGQRDCAYITWSTGIGVGLCVDGHILRGKNGNAGHAGHMIVSDHAQDTRCGCGTMGDLETHIGGNNIERRTGLSAQAWLAQAGAGDTKAQSYVQEWSAAMGRAIYNLCVTLDLRRVALGGSIYLHNNTVLQPLLQKSLKQGFAALTAEMDIVTAGLGLHVGDFAAMALIDSASRSAS